MAVSKKSLYASVDFILSYCLLKGLCNKKLGLYEDALEDFFKLHSIVRNHSEVVYQLANLYEVMGDMDQAIGKSYF